MKKFNIQDWKNKQLSEQIKAQDVPGTAAFMANKFDFTKN